MRVLLLRASWAFGWCVGGSSLISPGISHVPTFVRGAAILWYSAVSATTQHCATRTLTLLLLVPHLQPPRLLSLPCRYVKGSAIPTTSHQQTAAEVREPSRRALWHSAALSRSLYTVTPYHSLSTLPLLCPSQGNQPLDSNPTISLWSSGSIPTLLTPCLSRMCAPLRRRRARSRAKAAAPHMLRQPAHQGTSS